jgi:hypothetical protein
LRVFSHCQYGTTYCVTLTLADHGSDIGYSKHGISVTAALSVTLTIVNSQEEEKTSSGRVSALFPNCQLSFVCESETTKLYLKVTEPELVGAMFDKALERYTTSDVDQFTKGQQGS